MNKFKIGQRVITLGGDIGHIEEINDDNLTADVRVLTPNNEPSCCLSVCFLENLNIVPDSVVPMQQSAEWWNEAKSFHEVIESAVSR